MGGRGLIPGGLLERGGLFESGSLNRENTAGIGNRMVSRAIWKKHARVNFSKTIISKTSNLTSLKKLTSQCVTYFFIFH